MSVTVTLNPSVGLSVTDATAPRIKPSECIRLSPYRPSTSAAIAPNAPSQVASDEWHFDNRFLGFTGYGGGLITPFSVSPTFGAAPNYSFFTQGVNHSGQLTPVDELANESWCLVFRKTTPTGSCFMFGNLTGTSTDGGWGLIYTAGTGWRISTRAAINNVLTITWPGAAVEGSVVALFVTHSASARKIYPYLGSVTSTSLTRRLSSPITKMAVGEYSGNSGQGKVNEYFAAIPFPAVLSTADMDIVFGNVVAYYARKNIPVV